MEASILIAKILGVIYASFALGMIINRKHYKKALPALLDSPSVMLFSGFFATAIGFLILHFQNTWTNDWTTVITLIGWIALIKGVFLFVFPNTHSFFKKAFAKNCIYNIITLALVVLAAVFLILGF